MQIGLALNNYLMAHEVLPPGTQNATGPIQSKEGGGYHMSWVTQILPYLEQQNVYNHIDFTKSVYDTVNVPARQQKISMFVCPSDPGSSISAVAAVTNYCGVHNDFETPIDVNQNGVLFLNSSIRYEQIRDGSSNTIFVMEAVLNTGSDLGWMSGTKATLRNAVIKNPGSTQPAPTTDSQDANGTPPAIVEEAIYNLHFATNSRGIVPNVRQELADLQSGRETVGGPSSFHTGGGHYLLGDGSVRFISQNIDPKTLRNLAHRADGEMLKDF